jgi:hypothetical protein
MYGTIRKPVKGLESGKKYNARVAAVGVNSQVVYSDVVSGVRQ